MFSAEKIFLSSLHGSNSSNKLYFEFSAMSQKIYCATLSIFQNTDHSIFYYDDIFMVFLLYISFHISPIHPSVPSKIFFDLKN